MRRLLSSYLLFAMLSSCAIAQESPATLRWWKGNLHTHSLWSDGDDFPEMISDWYREHGYNFLAISDHNLIQEGQRWISVKEVNSRSENQALSKYLKRFPVPWVELRGDEPNTEVRLKPLDEYRYLLEQHDQFILIPSEEISDQANGLPIHLNATNLYESIKPVGGRTVVEVIENNIRAVMQQAEMNGREIMVHLNHPNFHYAVTARELAAVVSEQFFEVYNGHPDVHNLGDKDHLSTEKMWDLANTIRIKQLGAQPLLGIATDDTHEYHDRPGARPGRGWVMVQSEYLTPEFLIKHMRSGRFYATSGVLIDAVQFDETSRVLSLTLPTIEHVEYETVFIGTIKSATLNELPSPEQIGTIMSRQSGTTPSYPMDGTELYVRAVVTSSRDATDPAWPGQKQQAWTQPVGYSIDTTK